LSVGPVGPFFGGGSVGGGIGDKVPPPSRGATDDGGEVGVFDGSGPDDEDDGEADDVAGMALPPPDPQALSRVAARTSVATTASGLLTCTLLGRYD
jgi:hypothetical protein